MIKQGRPAKGTGNGEMVKVTFRLDEETSRMLADLELREGPAVRGRMSTLLRRLIRDEFARALKKL